MTLRKTAAFRPRSRLLALEPRVLFDGAAAVAVEQQAPPAEAPHAAPAEHAAHTLAVVDGRLNNAAQLATELGKDKNTRVVVIGQAEDGLAVIGKALAQEGSVDAIEIFSHGATGQVTLGSRVLSADNIAAASVELQSWSAHLSSNADILLFGCNTGAGPAGQALIHGLATATGADVAASTDDTGSANAGGNWTLEVSTGAIDTHPAALGYDGLLANASPTVALSATTMDTLLGGQLSFTASFTNAAPTQAGYAPFIDLILPATGKDGAGTAIDDGITFVSATYLGQTVKSYTITFDASGNATHPLAKDISGQPVIVNAAAYGAQAGDQLVVLQLPYASVINGQPAIPVVVTCLLSNLADTDGSPDLTIKARGGFEYGNDSADNPTTDPSLFEGSMHDLVVHPTGLQLTQSINMPEGETVTGPNFERSVTVTATPPPGQTLTDVDITQSLPNTIRVTSITPGAGGTITSITVGSNTLTNSALIAQVLAQKPFLTSYTVRYASLTAPTNTVVKFYVPDKDATGADILDPVSGDDRSITLSQPTATAKWVPLDPRDQTVDPGPPPVVLPADVTVTGNSASFVAMSVALNKSVAIASNTGGAGLTPGDELQYTLNVNISDYFAIGKTLFNAGSLTVSDQLGDGQQLVAGSPVLTVYAEGVKYNIALVTTTGPQGPAGTTLSFDIAQSLANTSAIFGGALIGDIAFDGDLEGATRATITYRSTVAQAYTTVYPQSEINEGDSIGNSATVSGTLLANDILLTGGIESDTSAAALTVPTHTVSTSILTVNGATPPASVELKPGDVVTFKLAYNLETGDYENFKLSSYLPLPLFDLTGLPLTQGSGVGQWSYGAGNTNADLVDSVTVGAGNSLVFDFGSYATSSLSGSRVEVQFTLTVGNQPFADQRPLTVLGQSDQVTTIAHNDLVSSGVVNIASVAEPVLAMKHGVVSVGAGSAGIVSGTTGSWAAAGSAGAPFAGSITDLAAVDGNVTGIDGGDLVRLATAIENSGGLGAFDVATTVTLPAGFAFSGGSLASAHLAIYRGDGSALVAGTDYSVAGSTITFLDHNGQPTLLPGRAGTANDNSGANVVVITYDVVASATIAASRNLQTTAALTNYSSVNGGPDFTPGADPTDTADQIVAAPVITKVFANGTLTSDDSSAAHTSGADLVIGENMLYDIVVKLPEGVTQTLRMNDLIPPGMTLDTSFGTGGYQIITTTAGSAALAANFAGTVTVGSASAPGGDGADLGLTFSAASASADNVVGNNSFVVRVRLIASNVSGNQAGVTRPNSAQLIYSDPDTDTPNGSAPIDRAVALGNSQPSISVREPTLTVTQTTTNNGGPLGVDRNDEITYTINLRNDSGINAFDISFLDTVPSQLIFSEPGFGLQSLTYAGGATNNGGPDFLVGGSAIVTDPAANIDIPTGASITLVIKGRVRSDLGSINDIVNTATAEWTSLDGTSIVPTAVERSGVDGLLNSGVLNDYRTTSTSTVPVAAGATISHVGLLADTPLPTPDTSRPETIAVGELIYYRVAFLVPEGDTANASALIHLPTGLSYAGDMRVALADGDPAGVTSDVVLTLTPGGPRINQDITDLEQSLLAADLSNAATAKLRTSLIDASNPNTITVTLGNVSNQNNDSFFQMLYLDFFVRVENTTAVDTSKSLNVTADFYSGALKQTSTPAAVENIVEPNLRDLQKIVTDFDPRTSQATGIATVSLNFSNGGDGIAYDAHLIDGITGGSGYALSSVMINGTSYAPGSLPAGVTVSTAGGISADFSTVAIGASIKVVYTVVVPNGAAIASTNATLNWSSLPETFTDGSAVSGGSVVTVGTDGTASGERDDGSTTTPNTAPNTYVVSEGAGLGIISGTLWDDTLTPTASTSPDGTRIANQTVTLTWAGADGDLATASDNRTYTAITDSNGDYHFGVLPSGNFRIDAPNPIINYAFGADTDNAAARIDSDGGTLGSVTISGLGEGSSASANIGYVRNNDAPVNTMPSSPTTLEDTPLAITGIFISDIDAGSNDLTVTLTVKHGTLTLTPAPGVTVSAGALGSATVTIQGAFDKLNTTLQSLLYTPLANYNGTDTLTVTTNDLGHTGDANGNLIPSEPADALKDTDRLTINITPVNDAPIGVNDVAVALEDGGVNNDILGYPGAVNVLKNDIDVDISTNSDVLTVSKIGLGASATNNVLPIGFTHVTGAYGELSINSQGNAKYTIDNANAAVQALRLPSDTLSETFTYELKDIAGLTSTATITVTIRGANDTPVGVDDAGTATEKGGVNNASGGSNATGNVLANDVDVDLNGETMAVTGIRYKREADPGVMTGVPSDNSAVAVNGSYGTLTIHADGNYNYAISNEGAAAVQRLVPGDTLIEYFSYAVTDKLGDSDVAQIKITINGAYDNPVASDDQAAAQAKSSNPGSQEVNPTGNVIRFQSRPGAIGQPGGNGIDTDVDRTDQPNSKLVVNGIRTGTEGGGGSLTPVSGVTLIAGAYGTLTINPDGSFLYDVDSTNPTVIALAAGATLTDTFTYRVADTAGLTDLAALNVIVRGVNDPPVASDVYAVAVEKGGVADATPGINPSGDVLVNDVDPDGNPITVTAVRTGPESGSGTSGTVGSALAGSYGRLTLNANGTYTYVVDNTLAAVQQLRTSSDTLTDTFTYTEGDSIGGFDQAQIVVTIEGRNDNPVGVNDAATAVEAGGLANAIAGTDPSGNVLSNDTDQDGAAYGETKAVQDFRTGTETGSGTAGTLGTELRGSYGWLTLNADGSYAYRVDNDMAAVQALRTSGNTLTDTFSYTVQDAALAIDRAQLVITIKGANDAPVAINDSAVAVEKGGIRNGTAGTDPTGNVLTNDRDVDANGETKTVTAFTDGGGAAGTVGSALAGTYGSLTLNADGSYAYVVDNANPVVQALRTSSDTLTENFSYTMRDAAGATSSATLTLTIRGANDNPVAADDRGTAVEAGGVNNATPGSNASGNVLGNDSDVDAYGETKSVTAFANGGGTGGTVGSALVGLYGSLTLNADGSYTYVIDNSNATVQSLRTPLDTLSDTFSYTVSDKAGATDVAQLAIKIRGANDAPLASNDQDIAWLSTGPIPGYNPSGNVLPNDSDVDAGDTKIVTDIGVGGSTVSVAAGTSGTTGQTINGSYGALTIGSDGSYQYVLDSGNAAVIALRIFSDTLTETFNYTMRDTAGATSSALLTITIHGTNHPPIAVNDTNVASDQTSPPVATGNVLPNDIDPDINDTKTVTAIRTGSETGTGTTGTLGAVLQGKYGALVINADGSYRYEIDLTNLDVQKAAGQGRILSDIFTYTMRDALGYRDQAELAIALDISAPYVEAPGGHPYAGYADAMRAREIPVLGFQPIVFIDPTINRIQDAIDLSDRRNDGGKPWMSARPEIQSGTIAAHLRLDKDVFVDSAVRESQSYFRYDSSNVESRPGVIDLTADGVFEDLSIFAPTTRQPDEKTGTDRLHIGRSPAPSFSEQLRQSAMRNQPLPVKSASASRSTVPTLRS